MYLNTKIFLFFSFFRTHFYFFVKKRSKARKHYNWMKNSRIKNQAFMGSLRSHLRLNGQTSIELKPSYNLSKLWISQKIQFFFLLFSTFSIFVQKIRYESFIHCEKVRRTNVSRNRKKTSYKNEWKEQTHLQKCTKKIHEVDVKNCITFQIKN